MSAAVLSALALAAVKVVTFAGFEDERYQRHDRTIAKTVEEFNAGKGGWAGASARQAAAIPELRAALVKAQMIQESGGNDLKSRAAWRTDPLQINVLGDWNEYKRYLGLRKPRRINDGDPETNVRAAVKYLVRKGFGASGQPAANRPEGVFDGWKTALKRYNGRTDRLPDGRVYSDAYAERIVSRGEAKGTKVPISLKKNE